MTLFGRRGICAGKNQNYSRQRLSGKGTSAWAHDPFVFPPMDLRAPNVPRSQRSVPRSHGRAEKLSVPEGGGVLPNGARFCASSTAAVVARRSGCRARRFLGYEWRYRGPNWVGSPPCCPEKYGHYQRMKLNLHFRAVTSRLEDEHREVACQPHFAPQRKSTAESRHVAWPPNLRPGPTRVQCSRLCRG